MISSLELAKALHNAVMTYPSDTDKVTQAFLDFVDEKKLTTLLPQVARHLERMKNQADIEKTVLITVTHKLASEVMHAITQFMNAPKNAPVEVVVDESIKGGFIGLYANKVYDASVRTSMEKIRTTLLT